MLKKSDIALRVYSSEKEKAVALASHYQYDSLSGLMRFLLNKEFKDLFGNTDHGINTDDEKYDIHKGSYFYKHRDRLVKHTEGKYLPDLTLEFAYYAGILPVEEKAKEFNNLRLALLRMEEENLWNSEVTLKTVAEKAKVAEEYLIALMR